MKNLDFLGQPSYCVSNLGKVYSLKTNRFLKPFSDTQGYQYIECYKDGEKHRFAVHRLVALAFLTKPSDDTIEVNHIDGDKKNNNISNLEWVTPSQNCVHAERTNLRNNSTLTDDQVITVCKLLQDGFRNVDIANMVGTSKAVIADIKNLKTYKYISCDFDFTNIRRSSKISTEKVILICEMLEKGCGYKEITSTLNVTTSNVRGIKSRKYYKDISSNYKW